MREYCRGVFIQLNGQITRFCPETQAVQLHHACLREWRVYKGEILDVAVCQITPEEEKKSNLNGRNWRALKITQYFTTRLFVALKLSWQLSWHEIWPMLRPAGHVFFPWTCQVCVANIGTESDHLSIPFHDIYCQPSPLHSGFIRF